MNVARYLIAKYIPDLVRYEPRNIGVILWCESGVRARFWASDAHGNVDGREVPGFVASTSAYQQWIQTWLRLISSTQIEFIGKGELADVKSPAFLEALLTSSNGNYILQPGGELFEEITPANIVGATDFLYRSIVREETEKGPDAITLDEACKEIIREAELTKDPLWQENKTIPCTVGSIQKDYVFSYYYGNGKAEWLAQKVPLPLYPKELDKTVESFAWKFEKVVSAGIVSRDQSVALIYQQPEQVRSKPVQDAIGELSTVAKVVDVRNKQNAFNEFKRLSSISTGPTH
ncbi:MAG: hypothetical protein ACYDH9_20630 [Limisphaerales bacterium]